MGRVVVRGGKGDVYREVALNAEARSALDVWSAARRKQLHGGAERALFVSRKGARLSTRALDLVIRALAREADLALSAHTLRHTWLTRLVRDGADVVAGGRDCGAPQVGDDAALQPSIAGRSPGGDGASQA